MTNGGFLRAVRSPFTLTADGETSEQRRVALSAMALVLAVFALYWPTTVSLAHRWHDTVHRTYTHGYLVVAITLWLLWRGRARWVERPVRPFLPGAALLFAFALAWLIAYRAGLQIVHQVLLPLLVGAALLTCLGPAVARRMALPIAFLYFAIPIWDALNPILQDISVAAVQALLRVAGVPAFFEGNRFQIPAGSFVIADGCSGLHFFVVATTIAVLYGEVYRDSWRVRAMTVALAAGLAMATNWLRIFVIVMAGHLTDMQHRLIQGEHYTFGWFVFAGMMIVFFFIVYRLPAGAAPAASQAAAPASAPVPMKVWAATGAALLIVPLWNVVDSDLAGPERLAQIAPGDNVASWTTQPANPEWQPVFQGADVTELTQFASAGDVVQRYVALYERQRQGKEIVGHGNTVLGADLKSVSRASAVGPWVEIQVEDAAARRWALRYMYKIGGQSFSRPMRAQMAYAFSSLFDAPASAVIILRSPCAADCDAARAALDRFAADTLR